MVYAKRPLGGPRAVLAYLSRYTHRVAISNRRLAADDGGSFPQKAPSSFATGTVGLAPMADARLSGVRRAPTSKTAVWS